MPTTVALVEIGDPNPIFVTDMSRCSSLLKTLQSDSQLWYQALIVSDHCFAGGDLVVNDFEYRD